MLDLVLFNGIQPEHILVIKNSAQINLAIPIDIPVRQEPKLTSNKHLTKVIRLLFFGYILAKTHPLYIITNSSLTYKVWGVFFKLKHICYHRALLLDPKHKFGFSEKLRHLLKLKNCQLLNPFNSDLILTIGECNKNYLIAKEANPHKIVLIGPTWLQDTTPQNKKIEKQNIGKVKVFFITQAFDHHGYSEQHESQISFIKELDKNLEPEGFELFIRQHPRDYTNYETILNKKERTIKGPSNLFLSSITSTDVVISPFSTMSLELAFKKAKVFYYSTESLDKLYYESYKKFKLTTINSPVELADIISQAKPSSKIPLEYFFSEINKSVDDLRELANLDNFSKT